MCIWTVYGQTSTGVPRIWGALVKQSRGVLSFPPSLLLPYVPSPPQPSLLPLFSPPLEVSPLEFSWSLVSWVWSGAEPQRKSNLVHLTTGGNNFNDFPENQQLQSTVDFSILLWKLSARNKQQWRSVYEWLIKNYITRLKAYKSMLNLP